MTRCRLLVGLAGLSVLVLSVGAQAQDAAPPAADPAPAPQQASSCSGLGCLFGGNQPEQPAPAQSPQTGSAEPADAKPEDANDIKKATKHVGRPVHVVTIAAAPTEVARLQKLASALPKERIKIVKVKGEETTATDFTVSPSLASQPGEDQTKLFTEQMHILAGSSIRAVADLQGKVVSFGPEHSPGQAAARKAFQALNVRVNETPLDLDNALDGLATGDIDAVVVLAPQPVDRLRAVSAPGLHLVAWPQGAAVPEGASATTIDARAYPKLASAGDPVPALGVEALLTLNAKGAKQNAAKTFLKALSQKSETLTKRGFDLLKADLDGHRSRHLASAEHERVQ